MYGQCPDGVRPIRPGAWRTSTGSDAVAATLRTERESCIAGLTYWSRLSGGGKIPSCSLRFDVTVTSGGSPTRVFRSMKERRRLNNHHIRSTRQASL